MDDAKDTAQSLISRSIRINEPVYAVWASDLHCQLMKRCIDLKDASSFAGGSTKFWGREHDKEWAIYLQY